MPEVPVSLSWQALSRQARFLYALIISTLSNCRPNSGEEFCSELRHEEIQWSEVMSLLPCLSLHRQYWPVLTGLNSAIVQVKCQNSMHKIRAICKSDHSCSMKIKMECCISIDQFSKVHAPHLPPSLGRLYCCSCSTLAVAMSFKQLKTITKAQSKLSVFLQCLMHCKLQQRT